jgi:hypothetical protein
MRTTTGFLVAILAVQVALSGVVPGTKAFAAAPAYPAMAPLKQYLMPEAAEIALARSAAPPSVSGGATVMVLTPHGYTTAVKGSNGFVCMVVRSWDQLPSKPEFWNPKMRAPICFNAAAAKSFMQISLLKTKLILAGTSRSEIAGKIASAFDSGELPPLAPGAMCYMMSRQQYLNDNARNWHPHVMIYASGDVAKSWGANLPGSPVIAADDPEDHVTIFMIWANHWSDGTPYSP